MNPERTIPRALIFGTLTVAAIYLLVAFAVMGIVPPDQLAASSSPLTDAGIRIAGSWGGLLVSVGALVSTFGALNSALLVTGQTAMAAARDGLFPDRFQRMTRHHTPGFSFIAAGVLISALLIMNYTKGMVGAYTFVLLIATLTIVVPYAFSSMAALVLEMAEGKTGGVRRWRENIVAVLSFGVCMWVMASAGAETVYWGFLLLMAGVPVYVVVTRDRRRKGEGVS
ncbi:MAG: amino acid permease [Gemmatimonadales bacterium]|nr:MAG: amino acid permease [Gemmatimonadales bacterium]